jgi:alpha-mannosidase
MTYRSLITALPCHSLEDFPTHHTGDDADGLLAAWCLPWHPALIANSGRAPTWRYLHAWDDAFRESLILVPEVSRSALTDDWQSRAAAQQTNMIVGRSDFDGMVADALGSLADGSPSLVDTNLVADFHALGYWYLQAHLLTKHMHYSSHLDEAQFQESLLQAALTATAGETARAREHLQRCFTILAEERDHYYPVEAFVIDLILTTPATCDELLLEELAGETPRNVMINGETLEHLSATAPEALELLRAGVAAGHIALVGGEQHELPLPLLSCEQLLQEFRHGHTTAERLVGKRPEIFGRRRFGMSPFLPQVLKRLGYRGALHATLDDGRFPESSQARTQWQGCSGTSIDTLCSIPLNATLPETFLKFATRMGESMQMDYVATIVLAHWPGRACRWFDYLKRGADYGMSLGRFATLHQFFDHTSYTGHTEQYTADRYRSPYLRQAIEQQTPNVISQHVDLWVNSTRAQSARTLAAWQAIIQNASPASTIAPELPFDDPTRPITNPLSDSPNTAPSALAPGSDQAGASFANAARDLANSLGASLADAQGTPNVGTLLITPWTVPSRVVCQVPPGVAANHPQGPVFAVTSHSDPPHAAVDIPAGGFTWLADKNEPVKTLRSRLKKVKAVVQDNVLQNEFMEVHIDPATGGIRAIYDYQNRANRLSQQLVFLPPVASRTDRPQIRFSQMQARSVTASVADPSVGVLTTEGQLQDPEGNVLANFRQLFELWRGSRVLRVTAELEPKVLPGTTPWKSYYGSRVAWADESSILNRDQLGVLQPVTLKQFEAPSYVEIDASSQHTFLMNGGLTYHHRVGPRMLDTLLVVHGETARQFRWAIGVDLRHPLADCATTFVPPPAIRATIPGSPSGWLFHIDAKHVLATGWELLPPQDDGSPTPGFLVRLLETEGKSARVRLQSVRPIRSARRLDFLGLSEGACKVEDGVCHTELAANEWGALEVRW